MGFIQKDGNITRFPPSLSHTITHTYTRTLQFQGLSSFTYTHTMYIPRESLGGLCRGFCCSAVCLSDKKGDIGMHGDTLLNMCRVGSSPFACLFNPSLRYPPPSAAARNDTTHTHCLTFHLVNSYTHEKYISRLLTN